MRIRTLNRDLITHVSSVSCSLCVHPRFLRFMQLVIILSTTFNSAFESVSVLLCNLVFELSFWPRFSHITIRYFLAIINGHISWFLMEDFAIKMENVNIFNTSLLPPSSENVSLLLWLSTPHLHYESSCLKNVFSFTVRNSFHVPFLS